MYRLLGNPGQPAKKADARQEDTANAAALKRENRLGEPVEGAVDTTTAHNLLGGQ
jgi:hypothetical protein